jgi:predicted secreted protein
MNFRLLNLGPMLMAAWLANPVITLAATLSLDAQSRAQIANDEMVVSLVVERDGQDLAAINQQVLQTLNGAMAEAQRVNGVKARLGSIYTQPNWTPQGRQSGWKVRGEAVLTSRDVPALGGLAGNLAQRMQIGGVQFRLSDEARTQAEPTLIRSAAAAFRAKALEASTALGFKTFEIKDVNLNNAGQTVVRPMPRQMSMRSAEASVAAAPMPTEAGESEVVVTVGGTVELK